MARQILLPDGEVGKVIFDRPGTIHVGGHHLGFAQGGQDVFKLLIAALDVAEQQRLLDGFCHNTLSFLVAILFSPQYTAQSGQYRS